MSRTFNLWGEFTKAEAQEDGSVIVKGIASSEAVDSDGEIIKASAMKAAIPEYMKFGNVREMHGNVAAGSAISISVNEAGQTEFEAQIFDPVTAMKVNKGVLKGFSIGGRKTGWDPLNKKIITGIRLSEISVVDRPACPDAMFSIAKFDDAQKSMYDVGYLGTTLAGISGLVRDLQYEADWEGDNSTIPALLRDWLAEGCAIWASLASEEIQEVVVVATPVEVIDNGPAMALAEKEATVADLAKTEVPEVVTPVVEDASLAKMASMEASIAGLTALVKAMQNTPAASPLELAILKEKDPSIFNKQENKLVINADSSRFDLCKAAMRQGRPY